tara:strand:+ start:2507 stop:2941 length:435 start_codon:yes stop_codon:yes gene_type:complete
MDEDLRKNLTRADTWVRGLFMCLFMVVYTFAIGIWFLIVPFQFGHTLIVGKPNDPVLDFSENLCAYLYEILTYVSFGSEARPFPFGPWPNERTGYVEDQVERSVSVADETVEETSAQADDQVEQEDVSPAVSSETDEPNDQDKV